MKAFNFKTFLQIYLRHWAHDLDVPIISVDYSLAPEAPFPRALEEVLLTYAWILTNPEKLGKCHL